MHTQTKEFTLEDSMNYYDITIPVWPPSGSERSATDLAKPDERNLRYGITAEELQSGYCQAEKDLGSSVPEQIRKRITVSRDLGAHAWFCYEFHAVSSFWSISCVEMALRWKFAEENPGPFDLRRGAKGKVISVPLSELETCLRQRYRIVSMPEFDNSFHSLLKWAFTNGVLPRDIPICLQEIRQAYDARFRLMIFPDLAKKAGLLGPNPNLGEIDRAWANLGPAGQQAYLPDNATVLTEGLPRLRNGMAHPTFNWVLFPRSGIDAYRQLIEICRRLWK